MFGNTITDFADLAARIEDPLDYSAAWVEDESGDYMSVLNMQTGDEVFYEVDQELAFADMKRLGIMTIK